MGEALTNGDEVLFRQIHPTFLEDDGEPSSQPFRPSEKDEDKLSVDRETLTTPADSHALYVSNGWESVAVYGLSVGEFGKEKLPCSSNPLEKTDKQAANPAHALADYSAFSANKQKTIAKRLKKDARARGVLFAPPKAPAASDAPAA